MSKQSSIDYLHEVAKQRELDKFDWEHARQMHKQEIVAAFQTADSLHYTKGADLDMDGHEYYNETYGGNK